jgi:hypothetical protein
MVTSSGRCNPGDEETEIDEANRESLGTYTKLRVDCLHRQPCRQSLLPAGHCPVGDSHRTTDEL